MSKDHLLNKENIVKGTTLEFKQMKRKKNCKKNKNRCYKKTFYLKRHTYTAIIVVYITVVGL